MAVRINEGWCKSCGLCIANCPKNAIMKSNKHNDSGYETIVIDPQACTQCGICYTVCPDWVFEIAEER